MEIISKVNWVDLVVVIVMLRISYVSFSDGLSRGIFPLVGAVGTLFLSLRYYRQIADFLSRNGISLPIDLLNFISFLALVVVLGILFKVARTVIDKIITIQWHPLIERFGGLICGVGRALIFASIILMVLSLMPLSYMQKSIRDRSLSGMYVLRAGPTIYVTLAKFLPKGPGKEGALSEEAITKELVVDKTVLNPKPKKDSDKASELDKI